MLNRIVLIGRLTKDPEAGYTGEGAAIAKFRIAVDRPTKNRETGEKETDFVNVIAFRRTAEFVNQYMVKGRLVAVEGRLQIRQWVAQDGSRQSMTEVVADNVQGLDRRDAGDGEFVRSREPQRPDAQPAGTPEVSGPDDGDDPFAQE